jgi:hypothetical protein
MMSRPSVGSLNPTVPLTVKIFNVETYDEALAAALEVGRQYGNGRKILEVHAVQAAPRPDDDAEHMRFETEFRIIIEVERIEP